MNTNKPTQAGLLPFKLTMAAMVVLSIPTGCGKETGGNNNGGYSVNAVVAPVKASVLEEKIFLIGSMEAIDEVDLVSEVDARVTELNFEEGEPVSKDQLLIQLDARKLEAAVAEMRARYQLAKADLDRSATLLERETISEQDYDKAEAEFDSAEALLNLAVERLEDAAIRAPFHGVMTERLVSLGQYTTRGDKLASLVEMDPLEVAFNVPERYVGQLREGQRIETSVEAWPDEVFSGNVVFLSPKVDRTSRTVLVKARIANPDLRLKPGMFGKIELIFKARDAALVIPEAAISYANDDASVVVMNADGQAEFRQVQVGLRLAGEAEIISGLEAGERVVVEGFQKMGPGTPINISPESSRYGVEPEGS
jgi:membrane fusion protein (multidrug efflux system)